MRQWRDQEGFSCIETSRHAKLAGDFSPPKSCASEYVDASRDKKCTRANMRKTLRKSALRSWSSCDSDKCVRNRKIYPRILVISVSISLGLIFWMERPSFLAVKDIQQITGDQKISTPIMLLVHYSTVTLNSMGFSFSRNNSVSFIPLLQSVALFLSPTCASSSNGNNGNPPFLVVSEIVHDEGNEFECGKDIVNHNSSNNMNKMSENSDGSNICKVTGEGKTSHKQNHSFYDSDRGKSIVESTTSNGEGAGWSDTDDDDVNNDEGLKQNRVGDGGTLPHSSTSNVSASSSASTVSQPLKTLKKLQAMLDDTDYATTTLTSSPSIGSTDSDGDIASSSRKPGDKAAMSSSTSPFSPTEASTNQGVHPKKHSRYTGHDHSQTQKIENYTSPPSESDEVIHEKLWTSKDRSKYRRTRRTEKQRQQRDYEEQRAREIREIQRQRIIREERERKDLEELRRKQLEVLERERHQHQKHQHMQQQSLQHDQSDLFFEETDFTEETDTDGKGFELPNLPVYLSDAEQTDDFSEEAEDNIPAMKTRPYQPPGLSSPMQQMQQSYRPPQMQTPYQYPPPLDQRINYPQLQQHSLQHPPTQSGPYGPYPDYRQQSLPPYQQQQQQQQHDQFSQYSDQTRTQFNSNNQQIQDRIHQFEQEYAAWAQAARNGYYYPPPTHPAAFALQRQQAPQLSQNADYPSFPYENQQKQQQVHPQQQQQQRPPIDDGRQTLYGSLFQKPLNNNYQTLHHHSSIPSRTLLPPSSHASQAATNYQTAARGFFARDMNGSHGRLPQRQEQLQPYNYPLFGAPDGARENSQLNSVDREDSAPSSNVLSSIHNSRDNSVTDVASQPGDTLQQDKITASSESRDILGSHMQQPNQMIVASPDNFLAPMNAEGPYGELADETVCLPFFNLFLLWLCLNKYKINPTYYGRFDCC